MKAIACLVLLSLASCTGLEGSYADDSGLERLLQEEPLFTPAALAEVAARQPQLRPPFRLAIAPPIADEARGTHRSRRLVDGWTRKERATIEACVERLREQGLVHEHVFLPGLLVDRDPAQEHASLVERMRLAAVQLRCDAVLVVRTASRSSSRARPLAILDLTLIGGAIFPGHQVRGRSIAEGLLVDARNEYLYAAERGDAERTESAPAFFIGDRGEDLLERTRLVALERLTDTLGERALALSTAARHAGAGAAAGGGG